MNRKAIVGSPKDVTIRKMKYRVAKCLFVDFLHVFALVRMHENIEYGLIFQLVNKRVISVAKEGTMQNLHVGVPGYRLPKMISTHFGRLVTDSATTFPQSTFEGTTR